MKCPWCDSAGTWSGNAVAAAQKMSEELLAELAEAASPEIVVITGGEPTIHDLRPLADALHGRGLRVHLETCGAFPIPENFDWITVSPKSNKPPAEENWRRADELKFIITRENDLEIWERKFREAFPQKPFPKAAWLHPEWSAVSEKRLLAAIADFVRSRGNPWRAGWQLHKLYFVK